MPMEESRGAESESSSSVNPRAERTLASRDSWCQSSWSMPTNKSSLPCLRSFPGRCADADADDGDAMARRCRRRRPARPPDESLPRDGSAPKGSPPTPAAAASVVWARAARRTLRRDGPISQYCTPRRAASAWNARALASVVVPSRTVAAPPPPPPPSPSSSPISSPRPPVPAPPPTTPSLFSRNWRRSTSFSRSRLALVKSESRRWCSSAARTRARLSSARARPRSAFSSAAEAVGSPGCAEEEEDLPSVESRALEARKKMKREVQTMPPTRQRRSMRKVTGTFAIAVSLVWHRRATKQGGRNEANST